MKNLLKLIIAIAFVFNFQNLHSQNCATENKPAVNGTMGKKTDNAVFIGQSFKACKTGKLTMASFRIGGGNEVTNVELRIFEDKKIAQKPLHKQNITLPSPATPISNFEDVNITIENGGFQVEEGKTYTVGFFKSKSDSKKLLRFKSDNTNSFENGSLVANSKVPGGKRQNKDVDMIFSFTIE
ncbi:hypothetical protein FDT66_07640 [Polaribacter aestuariivivens]|uniref:Uncharacterized protein n=1 Tax=Polaribacter aestuariivivens TaxID=2304626 RepID=A0A5S3N602_9FLAO|nr:hypothetical protein [Polaribacter aestuariivivens]TMM30627.1 hypothetical protein FDT66_07640 [Polaribacter aestuariivivens]